jgi:hypothetical protein
LPSGGALVVRADGGLEARGAPVPVFAAAPNRKTKIEKTLEAL